MTTDSSWIKNLTFLVSFLAVASVARAEHAGQANNGIQAVGPDHTATGGAAYEAHIRHRAQCRALYDNYYRICPNGPVVTDHSINGRNPNTTCINNSYITDSVRLRCTYQFYFPFGVTWVQSVLPQINALRTRYGLPNYVTW